MTDTMKTEQRREAFEKWAKSRGHDTTIYGDGNYADEVIDLFDAWCAALDSQAAQAQPSGWVAVPRVGTSVRADHPITCLNPEPTFEVTEVRAEPDGNFAVRGENTCWFGIRGIHAVAASPSHSKEPGDEVPRCSSCNDSGDIHDMTGQWRGRCTCPAGESENLIDKLISAMGAWQHSGGDLREHLRVALGVPVNLQPKRDPHLCPGCKHEDICSNNRFCLSGPHPAPNAGVEGLKR